MDAAVEALGGARKTVFLTQGRLQLAAFARAAQHRYIVRAIDRPAEIDALPDCKLVLARGPFALADELQLMRTEKVETLVTKNSGGRATYAKIEAARDARRRGRHGRAAPGARSRDAVRTRGGDGVDRGPVAALAERGRRGQRPRLQRRGRRGP